MQRHLRLRRREDFAQLRKHGTAWRHPYLIMSVNTNALPHNRYGFITSKQLGNAVVRNRIRRLLREAVRQVHPSVQTGYDIAFIARKRIVGQAYQDVHRAVMDSLTTAGLFAVQPKEPPR